MQAIIDRKKRFLVDGQQFAMPRQVKELIYYDRRKILHRNWVYRVLLKFPRIKDGVRLRSRSTCALQSKPIYRQALALEREQNNLCFDRKLRKSSKADPQSLPYRHFRAVCHFEEVEREARSESSKILYQKSLKKQKYG